MQPYRSRRSRTRFSMHVVDKIDCMYLGMHDDICNIFTPMQKERKKIDTRVSAGHASLKSMERHLI